jgi:hypothetical protein
MGVRSRSGFGTFLSDLNERDGRNRSAGTMRSERQLSVVSISKAAIPLSARSAVQDATSHDLPSLRRLLHIGGNFLRCCDIASRSKLPILQALVVHLIKSKPFLRGDALRNELIHVHEKGFGRSYVAMSDQ